MMPQSGVCLAASAARKTACPVPWATETPEPPSGTRISGFPTELKGKTDYTWGRQRARRTQRQQKGRRTKKIPRTRKGRRTMTAGGTGAARLPRKRPTSGEQKGPVIHAQTATPLEGRG
ncbi:hypothetical protein NDU88_007765 [Pleurodeles waltl]|uniref:Uncharacterized protein n=1 Tax=Pleurodeles waltl TaxID=8319 RepID=A0AAV7RV06_PLEWA|nr:hypothetical protein NDU88_007765 [Pleurodeles waltl]